MLYTEQDRTLAVDKSLLLSFSNAQQVVFQFPPRILSDNRRGTWNEGELRGTEPVATLATSGPRLISLQWTYIIDSQDANSNNWTAKRIKKQILLVRGYYGRLRDPNAGADRNALTVKFQMWSLGGFAPLTARLVSIDVKHGETIVGTGSEAFPLRTDITVDLRLWTGGLHGGGAVVVGADGNKLTQQIDNLSQTFPDDWY